ncbi:MAG: M24 family metallopeptidase [Verrucomicrobia bacterium]|nr:M24 family metallopeptidase [Verrucomicrobiota bacterium]
MSRQSPNARFLYANTAECADLYYLCGVQVPDAFLAGVIRGASFVVVNRLEYGRVAAQTSMDHVYLLEAELQKASAALKLPLMETGPAELMLYYLQKARLRSVELPRNFPAALYARLVAAGIKVVFGGAPFFSEREYKSEVEAKAIRRGNAASAAGIRAAEQVLRASDIVGNSIKYKGRTLTSEALRAIVDRTCLERGALAQNTIVAGGNQACDPHEGGHGPLRPNQLIIVDCFPRMQATGYHGDMTRTFLKGRANEAQRGLVAAVQAAQWAALSKVKHGVSGALVHAAAEAVFQKRGYYTQRKGDNFTGFIHSTGHGLGLEVHESPRVSSAAPALQKGQVITIEPGLYYPGIGACRIEDVVQVTRKGYDSLSSMHYRWEIR